ncbi:MAG: hypothetical protein IIC06_05970 [Proteobacteria bacterium]|nr:hypothetical protein [Pseudomonadota bacterium]
MSQNINYEVQVQQGGRWSIHARFASAQKDAAINEGKELEKLSNVEAVKVIKEVFDSEREVHNEFIVYKSAGLKSKAPEQAKEYAARSSGDDRPSERKSRDSAYDDDDDDDVTPRRLKKGKERKTSTLSAVVVKLLMVILFSLCISALFAAMADSFLGGTTVFGVRMVGNAESNMLIGVFITSFLISAIAMAVSIMKGQSLDSPRRRKPIAAPARQPKPAPKKPAFRKLVPDLPSEATTRLDEAMKGIENFKAPSEDEAKTAEDKTAEDEAKTAEDETKTAEAEAKKVLDQATNERLQAELNPDQEKSQEVAEDAAKLAAELAEEIQVQPAAAEPALSPEAEEQKAYMMNFLSQALEGAQTDQKKMDNFNKFGVNLYLAGACEIVSQKNELDVRDRSKILADSVQVMGFKKSHAGSFANRYEEYLMADSRYMQMFQAGRNAMNIYATEESAGPRLLENALAEWNKPKPKEEQTGPITVLFTDIAGSTAMTQAMGDAGAQKVVRAHNRIVREALSANAGKEVKHTGDGIMASFTKTSDGVDASIQMQRETVLHNQNNPDLPLHMKIGLNAGEPIVEDNDLFGTTVQLSARIVDKAAADEIFVSEIVRGICAGKSFEFVNRGGYPMKGFGEDVILYEVVWVGGDDAAAEAS